MPLRYGCGWSLLRFLELTGLGGKFVLVAIHLRGVATRSDLVKYSCLREEVKRGEYDPCKFPRSTNDDVHLEDRDGMQFSV